MKKVSFTEIKYGTKEDYLLLEKHEKYFERETADRILKFMSNLNNTLEGYQVSRLEHSLQTATRAFKNGENDEMVVASLLHDIGDEFAPMNHSQYAAAVLRPYVSEKTYWIIEKHGLFQTYYSAEHLGGDKNAREKYFQESLSIIIKLLFYSLLCVLEYVYFFHTYNDCPFFLYIY